jgi:hypothetical protein
LQASGRKRNTFICVAPSCQASFRSRTLLGDDTSCSFPSCRPWDAQISAGGLGSGIQVFLSRKLVLRPASEVEGLLKTQVCVCVCVSLSLSLSLSLHVLWRSTLFYVDGFNAFIPAWALSFRLFISQSSLRVLILDAPGRWILTICASVEVPSLTFAQLDDFRNRQKPETVESSQLYRVWDSKP